LQAEDALSEAFLDTDTYDAAVLKKLHPAVLNEAVCVAYERFAHSLLDRKKITAVSALIFDTGRLQLYGQNYVEVVKNQLRFFKKTSVAPAETIYIDAFGKYTFGEYTVDFTKITDYSSKVSNGFLYNYVDCDKIKGKLFLRTRFEGDRVKLFKRNVSKTLKKLFCEYNIPVEKRNTLPVLCDDEGIVWIYGIGTVARCCADNKSSNIIYVEGENNG
jgi:tRNA(Ile)-lysidine synthase